MFVLCVGMYRSCSTWQYDIASHLVESHYGGRRAGFLFGDVFAQLDQEPPEPKWQVLKSHDGHAAFGRALAEGRALALYSYRDLRDVAFSLMHKFDLSFADLLFKERLLDRCLENDKFWSEQSNVLCQRYEDIIRDPVSAVAALARHLRIPLAEGEAERIAGEHSFEANQERTRALRERLTAQSVDLSKHENVLAADSHTLLHWNHLRKGEEGGWRQEANQQERDELAKICGGWLIARRYESDLSWSQASIDQAWQQFDHARAELANVNRQIIALDVQRVELDKCRQELESERRLREDFQTKLAAAQAHISLQDSRLLEASKCLALQAARLAETGNRIAQQDLLLAEAEQLALHLRGRVAELEALGPVTLKLAGGWRRLADQHPQACAALRPVARGFLRLLAS
jgi:Sulfotransferase domain